jgi:hypothetical protein
VKSVTFSKTVIGGEGETLEAGGTYSLNDASADHWIKRGIAVFAETEQPITHKAEEEVDTKAGIKAQKADKKSK